MSAQHTPGPWVTSDGYGPIQGGTAVQSTHDTNLICSCTGYYGRAGAQANARLIAAAPDLLAALQGMVEHFKDTPRLEQNSHDEPPEPATQWDYDAFQLIGIATAAIAKATGGAA